MRGYSDYSRFDARPHGQTAAQIAAEAAADKSPAYVSKPLPRITESRKEVLRRTGVLL
jgi:hypothetical protein